MENTLFKTADGSTTFYNSTFKQHYHSIFGAETESRHVFINLGLKYAAMQHSIIHLLEVGFGTGRNAVLAAEWALENKFKVLYTGLEAYPLAKKECQQLDFHDYGIHEMPWGEKINLHPYFQFLKVQTQLQDFRPKDTFNLVFYDAFAPESQPELWTLETFEKLGSFLEKNAILSTYCSKGYVQRNLKQAGFVVEKQPGPPRKREVIRAVYKP